MTYYLVTDNDHNINGIISTPGFTYKGEISQNREANGIGEMKYADGSIIRGQWQNGMLSGLASKEISGMQAYHIKGKY